MSGVQFDGEYRESRRIAHLTPEPASLNDPPQINMTGVAWNIQVDLHCQRLLHAANDGAQVRQFGVDVGVAAIKVIDPVDSGVAVGGQGGNDQ